MLCVVDIYCIIWEFVYDEKAKLNDKYTIYIHCVPIFKSVYGILDII